MIPARDYGDHLIKLIAVYTAIVLYGRMIVIMKLEAAQTRHIGL